MGSRSAVEEIRAAIERLTPDPEWNSPGPWRSDNNGAVVGPEGLVLADAHHIEDADFVEVLHRTVGAQVALLRSVLTGYEQFPGDVWATERNNALALARAINGDGSAADLA